MGIPCLNNQITYPGCICNDNNDEDGCWRAKCEYYHDIPETYTGCVPKKCVPNSLYTDGNEVLGISSDTIPGNKLVNSAKYKCYWTPGEGQCASALSDGKEDEDCIKRKCYTKDLPYSECKNPNINGWFFYSFWLNLSY